MLYEILLKLTLKWKEVEELHHILRTGNCVIVIVTLSQVKQTEALNKKQEERNKAFIPPKEKPLMKKTTKGRNERTNQSKKV